MVGPFHHESNVMGIILDFNVEFECLVVMVRWLFQTLNMYIYKYINTKYTKYLYIMECFYNKIVKLCQLTVSPTQVKKRDRRDGKINQITLTNFVF